MPYSLDYLDDVLVRMAYHSSGIEGNTISLPETVSIILEQSLPNGRKSVREFYEVENHRQAFQYLLDSLDKPLTVDLIKGFHALLVDRLQHDRGQFKSSQNAIIGAEFQTASPQETPYLMVQWIDNLNWRLEHSTTIVDVLADTHIQFERIHPFSDGNGRVGRLIILYLAMKYLKSPIMISQTDRSAYMEYLANQDTANLAILFEKSLTFERERMEQFHK